MHLMAFSLSREVPALHKKGVQIHFPGDRSRLSKGVTDGLLAAEALTANNSKLILNVCFNYGGRWDITQAAAAMAVELQNGQLTADQISEEQLAKRLSTYGLPDVDLLIRTGGDHRISNFLLWQAAYAELYFTPVLWPDFDEIVFSEAIASFASRERRFGCTGEQVRALLVHPG